MGLSTFFNPIVINNNGSTVVIHNRKEADFMVEQWLRIANDCVNLVNSTKKPDVFFMRYNLLIEELTKMAKVEKIASFYNRYPSQDLQRLNAQKKDTINDFLNRYCADTVEKMSKLKTFQSKRNKADKFFQSLKQYDDMMLDENIQTYHFLYERLIQSILAEQITIKHCPYCNKLISTDSKFCNYCGSKQ